ncbi:DoxX family protein [Nocardiopsis sp. RSe5-2]|uniref:DoxX family protein n=1 Tax=Nocardiopsis endophytica TaxID=3018445 RepID=A0ABT4UC39_9ACTN|nr:DoxX family protein [Nocardiopsis endophytica]MDA2814478.1 DoxX family protein [Nocardiopsis endophytica]
MARSEDTLPARGTALTVVSWVLQVIGAGLFLLMGFGKVAGWPDFITTFENIGAGQWLRYFVGVAELAGGIGVLIPRLAGLAASGLTLVVVGAALTHLVILQDSGWVLPVVLIVLMGALAWIRRAETASLPSYLRGLLGRG